MKIGILGYGNLGRGVECAIKQNPDCELTAVFTHLKNQITLAHLAQGIEKIKTHLRSPRKAFEKLNHVCAPRARL